MVDAVKIHLDSNGKDYAVESIRRLLDYNPETGEFFWKECLSNAAPVRSRAGSLSKRGYVSIAIDNKDYRAHRLAWLYVHGRWPSGQIDHINGITSDNRICNLREATCSQNQANAARRLDNNSGHKGVSLHKLTGKWSATIQHNRRRIHLGLFPSPEAASDAYWAAAKELHGDFARAA